MIYDIEYMIQLSIISIDNWVYDTKICTQLYEFNWIKITILPKEYKTRHDRVEKVIHWGLCKKIEVWPYKQMVYAKPNIYPGEWDAQTPLGFWDTNGSPNLG